MPDAELNVGVSPGDAVLRELDGKTLMRPNTKPASADRLRAYAAQLREMAHDALDASSRTNLMQLAGEFDALAVARDMPPKPDSIEQTKN